MEAESIKELVQEEKDKLENIVALTKEYVETRMDLVAINVQDKVADLIASAVATAALWILGVFMLLLLSVGVALTISEQYKDPALGFYCVGGFYLLIGVVLYF